MKKAPTAKPSSYRCVFLFLPPAARDSTDPPVMTDPIVAISLSSRLMPLASASPSPSPSAPVFPSAQDRLQSRTRAVVVAPRWHMAELSLRRLNPVWHGAVSCSRSSNRTGAFRATALGERSRGRPRKAPRPPGEAKLVTHGGFRKLPPLFFNFDGTPDPIQVAGSQHSSQGPFV